jgi:hypothetical protein
MSLNVFPSSAFPFPPPQYFTHASEVNIANQIQVVLMILAVPSLNHAFKPYF